MKNAMRHAIIFLIAFLVFPGAAMAAESREDLLTQCFGYMAKIQAMVEYFYMETGVYPKDLKDMEGTYNELVPKEFEKVTVPKDPATGKNFGYVPSPKGDSYVLSCPEPARYGLKKLELSTVQWGWMKAVAQEKRREGFISGCLYNIKGIATAMEMYARKNNKKYPEKVKNLIPEYISCEPKCPLTGKEFIYEVKPGQYKISCPNPSAHGLGALYYSSSEGVRVLREAPKSEPKPEKK